MNDRFVIVDVETTGNRPKNGDRIIQVGAVVVENGQITERFSSFVNTNKKLTPFIQELTKINEDMLVDAPQFDEIAPKLLSMLENSYFVAHNVPFDMSFLQEEFENSGYRPFSGPCIDTVELARLLYPALDSYKLSQLAEIFKMQHSNPHRADSDAEVTAKLLLMMLEKLSSLPLIVLQRLERLVPRLDSDLEFYIKQLINEKTTTLQTDEEQFDVFRGLVLKPNVQKKSEPDEQVPSTFGTFQNEVTRKLKAEMSRYEERPGQAEMMKTVDEALSTHQHLLIEAGTGTGKSLGYLLPSLYTAKKNEQPVVVSTHTIQLQEQLLERDIPLLKKIVPFSFNGVLLKGRNHYLCLRKFEHSLSDVYNDNYDTILTKAQILIWLTETEHGDVEELNLSSGGKVFWNKVKSDAGSCLNRACPFFSRCFYHRKRNEAHDADLIVTNHALLFTDLTNESSILPAYNEVVIDESHHIEETASEHFGEQLDYFMINMMTTRLGMREEHELTSKLFGLAEFIDIDENVFTFLETMEEQITNVKNEADDLFRMLKVYVNEQENDEKSDIGRISYRYDVREENSEVWNSIVEVADRFKFALRDLGKAMQKVSKAFDDRKEHMTTLQRGILIDFQGVKNQVDTMCAQVTCLLLEARDNDVTWIEADVNGALNATYLYSQPIEVSEMLAERFFEKKKSAILTSATLTINNSFSFIEKRLGLTEFHPMTAMIASPFSYRDQVRLMIPSDIPNIKYVSNEIYTEHLAEQISELAQITNGRMLVLFTSYEMLRTVYYLVKKHTTNETMNFIAQGVTGGSRTKLTKRFQQSERAVLFGTSSFWEGVDIPGEALSCLVIVRLPFSPPNSPIMSARSERLKAQGKSPFMELSLPQAIIRFKQGFGRLVRTQSDKGAVFVFDRRITTTRYGKKFINSLPVTPVMEAPSEQLYSELEKWL
ncbi:ATP-dependent DNA helicase DinG [Bacillus solimangrovi]|uniref:3'-5' exonuclease DinG n=1 Tax=Bacillus solimangrovi TaxID=1305675 RepID=A0A1E5LH63_9BACI|nr:ATP-dependent DNA helicase DinG [Bacillus solimangrovi]OEH93421.1 ATP-dependent helicase DinG [Bacillus solimangrovi]